METTGIDHVNLRYPADRLDAVIDFYVDALGFETGFDDPREAVANDPGLFAIDLGNGFRLFVAPSEEFDPGAANYRHLAVRIPLWPSDLAARLSSAGVAVDQTAEREHGTLGAYTSYYVEDPVGYTVECMAVGEGA